jgi:superfamily II DNA/RNA helicase
LIFVYEKLLETVFIAAPHIHMYIYKQICTYINTYVNIRIYTQVVSALIFVNDPYRVEIVYEKLLEMGFIAAPLHGESSKDDRKEIIGRYNIYIYIYMYIYI